MPHVILGCLAALFVLWPHRNVLADVSLPVGPHTPAIDVLHFPDRAHALVWRNWTLVQPQRLAKVLGTSVENVQQMARSMGLPEGRTVCARMLDRGYMTILRRNWHLLPYEQLLELLDISAQELDFRLREDDFAFIKLGSVKPRCEPVHYREPDQAVRARTAQIKQTVQRYFGNLSEHNEQPRFSFIDQWNHVPKSLANKSYDPSRMHESLRCLYSYFGEFGDPLSDSASNPYPEGLLAELADRGVNGVWMHVVLRQLAPGGADFPEFGAGHERRLKNLWRLVRQARKYGIGVYLYLNEPRAMPPAFFKERPEMAGIHSRGLVTMCTSDRRVRQWMTEATAHVFREVPDLAGVFTITASENPTNCAFAGGQAACPRCRHRSQAEIVAEVNAAIEEGVHRGNPAARVIAWDWGWNNNADASDTIAKLPQKVQLMSVSEWGLPIVRGGVESRVGEHAISAVGPGPRAKHHWAVARERGLQTIACVHVNTTCELMSVPYLPVMDLVARHAVNLAQEQLDGVMLSWTMGGYPSPNLKVFQAFSQQPDTNIDDVLNGIARDRYGEQAAQHARKAWTAFSQAFQEYPYHVSVLYYGPQQMGPANLLYWKPTGYHATMVGIAYDDLKSWRGPYPPDVFIAQFNRVATGWQEGLHHLEQVVAASDASQRPNAASDLRVARAAWLHFASTANQARFIVLRDQLQSGENTTEQDESLRRELSAIVQREIKLARQLYELTLSDARIGFEASCHYFYVPLDLVEKTINCDFILQQLSTQD